MASSANSDGANPDDGLIQVGDTLYGVAAQGGINTAGTIFSIGTAGTNFTVLHYFAPLNFISSSDFTLTNSDGYNPSGTLAVSGSTLFGYAPVGGLYGNGTLFSITPGGSNFNVLHTFPAIPVNTNFFMPFPKTNFDGANPSGLIGAGDTLFGTAKFGGSGANGTVFAMATNGAFGILLNFAAASSPAEPSGANPVGNLCDSDNVLYGVTEAGGANGSGCLFAVTNTGAFSKTLHSFAPLGPYPYVNSDGGEPLAGLVPAGNALFGSTDVAGTNGSGTLFSVTDGTNFAVLHTFGDLSSSITNSDGGYPVDGLTLSGNTLYGTTGIGGAGGQGIVFSLHTDGSNFTPLYNFTALSSNTNLDGAQPNGNLVLSGNTLYGTTQRGGRNGNGTVFALNLTAPPPLPGIGSIRIAAGSNLVFTVPDALAGTPYTILISTNMLLPLAQWTPLVTNVPAASGTLTITVTNTVSPTVPGRFYILRE